MESWRSVGFTLSGTIGRASHSLISHTKGARSTGEVEGQQRLTSLLLIRTQLLHTTGIWAQLYTVTNQLYSNSLSLIEFAPVLSHLVRIYPLYTKTVCCGGWGNSRTIWHVFTSVVSASIYEEKSWHRVSLTSATPFHKVRVCSRLSPFYWNESIQLVTSRLT